MKGGRRAARGIFRSETLGRRDERDGATIRCEYDANVVWHISILGARPPTKIVVAPDKFKGSLTAEQAAHAMVRGARRVHPTASFTIRPMADGGEGSLDALMTARGGRTHDVAVTHPLGATVNAAYGRFNDGDACVETARASGLQLLGEAERNAIAATSLGTGELIMAAVAAGAPRVVVAVGGTASTDGGTGAARALGWRFLDARGAELSLGGGALVDLARIDGDEATPVSAEIVAACDVDSPLVGPVGAARRFGPQKGATPDDVELLEAGLANLAQRIANDVGIDVSAVRGAGAGGGLGAGLVAFFGATLRPGFELIAEVGHLADDISDADLVITGEGRLDDQSFAGKAPIGVARLAKAARVACVGVAGDLVADRGVLKDEGMELAVGIVQTGGAAKSERDPAGALEDATAGLLKHRMDRRSGRRLRQKKRRRWPSWSY